MPSLPAPESSPEPGNPLRTAYTPPSSLVAGLASLSLASTVQSNPFSVLSIGMSDDGDEVDLQFSDRRDQRFTFPTWWLYNYRASEGLPSPDGCTNPSKIRVIYLEVTGIGVRATVNITWNTGTTSSFPALWLRVFSPTNALEQERIDTRLPVLSGKNPRSGVEQLTLDEKRVADRYRALLIETMKDYLDQQWLPSVPTSLLREMVRYVEVELQRGPVAAQVPVADASQNDTNDEGSSMDEEML